MWRLSITSFFAVSQYPFISREKSFISDCGCFEFAKRFFVSGGRKDLSPISARMIAALLNQISRMTEKYLEGDQQTSQRTGLSQRKQTW